jgi:RNase P subunit RPR2
MVSTVPTGDGAEMVEVYANKSCRGCQALLVAPHVQLGYKAYYCTEGESGHRTLRCLDCGTVHYEPEHRD